MWSLRSPFPCLFVPPYLWSSLYPIFSIEGARSGRGEGRLKFFLLSVSPILLPASLVPCHAPLPEPHLVKDLLGGPGEARREGDPQQNTAGLGGHKSEGPLSLTIPQMNKSQTNQLLFCPQQPGQAGSRCYICKPGRVQITIRNPDKRGFHACWGRKRDEFLPRSSTRHLTYVFHGHI